VRLLKDCIVGIICEAWYEECYVDATAENLMLSEPGHIVEPEVRKKFFAYLKQMQLVKGKNISPKGPKRKAVKA
jgi:hypothetical protein